MSIFCALAGTEALIEDCGQLARKLFLAASASRCPFSRPLWLGLFASVVLLPPLAGIAIARTSDDSDLQDLRGLKTDTATLTSFLKSFCKRRADYGDVREKLNDLGSPVDSKRHDAARWFVELGPRGLVWLAYARQQKTTEAAKAAKLAAENISSEPGWRYAAAAAHVLLRRGVASAIDPLMAYLPFVADEELRVDLWYAYDTAVGKDPSLKSKLMGFLTNSQSDRRALAAFVLASHGGATEQSAAAKLLQDTVPIVRLRTAQGLLAGRSAIGVPTLIALLDEADLEIAWQAEELLHWIAGPAAPSSKVGAGTAGARRAARLQWYEWWGIQAAKLSFRALEKEERRPTLFLAYKTGQASDGKKVSSGLAVVGCDGQLREICPINAVSWRILPGNRLLYADPDRRGVFQRELQKSIDVRVWGWSGTDSCKVELLSSGDTLVLWAHAGAREITPEGDLSFRTTPGQRKPFDPDLKILHRFANRELLAGVYEDNELTALVRLDGANLKKLQEYPLPEKLRFFTVSVLPRGGWLVSAWSTLNRNRVFELDKRGKQIWEHAIEGPERAWRLKNSNTVVSGEKHGTAICWYLVECTPRHQLVQEVFLDAKVALQVIAPLVRLGFERWPRAHHDLALSVPYHLKGLQSRDPQRRRVFADKLADVPAPLLQRFLPDLVSALDNSDRVVGIHLVQVITKTGQTAAPLLEKALKDKSPFVRINALLALSELKRDNKEIYEHCLRAWKDKDPRVRLFAIAGIEHWLRVNDERTKKFPLTPSEETHLKKRLVTALTDPGDAKGWGGDVASEAILTMLRHKLLTKEAVPGLREILRTHDLLRTRGFAAYALGTLKSDATDAVPDLIKLVERISPRTDEEKDAYRNVIVALGEIGRKARSAIPALSRAASNSDPKIASAAREALGKLEK